MTVLIIFATIFSVALTIVTAITIAYEALAFDKTPAWLEKAYNFVWNTLEKVFLK